MGYLRGSKVKKIISILQQKRGILIFFSFVLSNLNNEKREYLKAGSTARVWRKEALETY